MNDKLKRIYKFFTSDIWEFSLTEATKKMYALVATIRVLSITVTAFNKNKILSQASSLSYTSLLALGPLIALAILSSTMFLQNKGSEYVYTQLINTIEFALPALADVPMSSETPKDAVNPQVLDFIENITKSSTSLGMFGTISVIITCILLCATMENAFNYLWNVRQPRRWVQRIVFYWALVSIGSALGVFGMTYMASSQLSNVFKDVPYFEYFEGGSTFFIGFGSISILLAFVYKFLPNAHVRFFPALVGAIFATTTLYINNKLSFIYIGTIVSKQNVYGYLAVLPLALFSLYVFWVLILIGAQVSFSVQNLDSLSTRYLWSKLSNRTSNLVCLAIFSNISRRFLKEQKAPCIDDLALDLKLAKPLVSYSLSELLAENIISKVEGKNEAVYKPAISPENITIAKFFERLNASKDYEKDIASGLSKSENSVSLAIKSYTEYQNTKYASMTIKEIL